MSVSAVVIDLVYGIEWYVKMVKWKPDWLIVMLVMQPVIWNCVVLPHRWLHWRHLFQFQLEEQK